MHSTIFALLTIAGLASASPAPKKECPGSGGYYVCASNGFRGYCSVDPCYGYSWCPDFKTGTCDKVDAWEHQHDPTPTPTPSPVPSSQDGVCPYGTGFFQVCSNGFRGCCKSDACGPAGWCPDYKTGTYEPKNTWKVKARQSDPTVCAPGTGFFQSCSNGFRGCCKSDACGPAGWCADYKTGTYEPVTGASDDSHNWEDTTTDDAATTTTTTTTTGSSDPTVCAPGTGFFQSCSNGFRGCCKSDACGPAGWCPDYKTGTYEPKNTWEVKARQSDPTVCAPGTGFFQVCANGFRGCCKGDACSQKGPYCPTN